MTEYSDLEEVARQIVDGSMRFEDAVLILARRANVDDTIAGMAIKARTAAMGSAPVEKARAEQAVRLSTDPITPKKFGSVPGQAFSALLLKYEKNQTQAAKIIGRSPSRVHELVTNGASQRIYDQVEEALSVYAQSEPGN